MNLQIVLTESDLWRFARHYASFEPAGASPICNKFGFGLAAVEKGLSAALRFGYPRKDPGQELLTYILKCAPLLDLPRQLPRGKCDALHL